MKKILELIQLLLAMNTITIKKDKDYFEHLLENMRQQGILIEKLQVLAQKKASLLGRIITFPSSADGKCIYVITKIFPRTVQIDWLNYGDGWSDARAGHQALLDIEFAKARVAFENDWTLSIPKPKIICSTITASPEKLKEFQS